MSKLLLYCCKAKPMLRVAKEEMKNQNRARCYSKEQTKYFTQYIEEEMYEANGKIVAECDFEVEEIKPEKYWHSTEDFDYIYNTGTIYYDDLLKKSCLMDYELDDYLGCEEKGYAIHIKNLHIFDKPKELSEYYSSANKMNTFTGYEWVCESIDKAPQNMMYAYDEKEKQYILISIQPQWLCKILNGEKTIEIRKKVLKEMLK